MSGKKKAFIAVGILLNIVLCAGLYVNYKLDQVVSSLTHPGVLFTEAGSSSPEDDGLTDGSMGDNDANNGPDASADGSGNRSDDSSSDGSTTGDGASPSNVKIAGDVQKKIGKPIEKNDLLKAGLIIIRRLDSDEISFLYQVGRKDSYTQEELQQARKILTTKLSSEDRAVLKALGQKYGKELNVLDV